MPAPLFALELADAGVVCAGPDGALSPPSPGLALSTPRGIVVGAAAAAHRRLEPRAMRDDFWDALDEEPLGPPFAPALRHADLVHAHLAALGKDAVPSGAPVLLALHGARRPAQLALLLGIARAAGLEVAGLVDAAVAAVAATGAGEGRFVHVDLELHRAVVTELVAADGKLARTRSEATAHGNGLARLHERWASRIAATFVRETRWDPRHDGSSDQALWEALPGLLAQASTASAFPARLGPSERPKVVELRQADLVEVARETFERIAALIRTEPGATLLLSDRAASLPGLVATLARAADADRTGFLAPGAAARGALGWAGSIRVAGDALPFVTRLSLEPGAARGAR